MEFILLGGAIVDELDEQKRNGSAHQGNKHSLDNLHRFAMDEPCAEYRESIVEVVVEGAESSSDRSHQNVQRDLNDLPMHGLRDNEDEQVSEQATLENARLSCYRDRNVRLGGDSCE